MDVLFLDANVLFSAAYREDAGVSALWRLPDARLVSSTYAVAEARRNLHGDDRVRRLERLVGDLHVYRVLPDRVLPGEVTLPAKDRPILVGAIGAGATHLITGDIRHFGPLLGTTVEGVRVLTPSGYLAGR